MLSPLRGFLLAAVATVALAASGSFQIDIGGGTLLIGTWEELDPSDSGPFVQSCDLEPGESCKLKNTSGDEMRVVICGPGNSGCRTIGVLPPGGKIKVSISTSSQTGGSVSLQPFDP